MAGRGRDIHGGDIWLAARSSGARPSEITDFSASINPLGPPASVERAVRKAIGSIPPYPDPSSTELREALAAFHGIDPGQVVAANGSNEIISLLPRLLDDGPALVVEPAFSEYEKALSSHGVRVKRLVLRSDDGFRLDVERLGRAMEGVSAVYVANPSNPAGVLTPAKTVVGIMRLARAKGALAVIDEAFADFTGVSVIPEAVKASNAVVVRSMTKFYAMAGLRLGYAVGNKRLMGRLGGIIPAWSVNTLASAAGVAAIGDGAFRKKTHGWLEGEKEFLYRALSAIKGLEPLYPSANYVMVRLSGGDSRALRRSLFERDAILIRELAAFKGLGPEYFRVAVMGRKDNERLVEALRRYLKKG